MCGVCNINYTKNYLSARYPYFYSNTSRTYIHEYELNLKSIYYTFENQFYEIDLKEYGYPDFVCHNCFNVLFTAGKAKYENFEQYGFEKFNDYTTRYLIDTENYFREGLKRINDVLKFRTIMNVANVANVANTTNVRCSETDRKKMRYSPY